MYSILLWMHSYNRWLVLICLFVCLFRSYRGLWQRRPFTKRDERTRLITINIVHLQLLLGICLYIISPLVSYFLHHYNEAVKEREIRFFGMEHSSIMLIAVVLITIGSAMAKRKTNDSQKHKAIAVWLTIGLLLILSSIPWQFSPLISRPSFRSISIVPVWLTT